MEHKAHQFVNRREFSPVQKTSSFYIKIENFDKFGYDEKFESKRFQFLDGNSVWWVSIGKELPSDTLRLRFFLDTTGYILTSKIWSWSVSGTVNKLSLESPIERITKKESSLTIDDKYNARKSSLELKFTISIVQMETYADKIPLKMFIDSTVQYKKIISNNKQLLNESNYSDFTFVVQGTPFKVHKNILATASPVFNALFTTNFSETVTNECQITDVQPAIFKHLLSFIYCGELPEKLHEMSQALYEAAHYYEIGELEDVCLSVERYHLSKENAVDVYGWAEGYDLKILLKEAWRVIKFEILEIFDEKDPPSFETVRSLIEKKREKERLLEQYQQRLSELETATEALLK